MNSVKVILLTVFAIAMYISGVAQNQQKTNTTIISEAPDVEVYYFHYTRRCATCNAVEDVAKAAINELYAEKVSFASINLDEKKGEAIGQKLKVSGQTLLIVAGATKINITNEAFMNARSKPEKLKALIKEKIDPLI